MSGESTCSATDLRAQLEPWQLQVVEKLDHEGPLIHRMLKGTTILRRDVTNLSVRDDGDVRAVLGVLKTCRDLLDWCEWYDKEAVLEVNTGGRSDPALVRDFLKGAVNFSHIAQREAWELQEQLREIANWLTAAARHRGLLAPGQKLGGDEEKELRYSIALAKVVPPTVTPSLAAVEPDGGEPTPAERVDGPFDRIERGMRLFGLMIGGDVHPFMNEEEIAFRMVRVMWPFPNKVRSVEDVKSDMGSNAGGDKWASNLALKTRRPLSRCGLSHYLRADKRNVWWVPFDGISENAEDESLQDLSPK